MAWRWGEGRDRGLFLLATARLHFVGIIRHTTRSCQVVLFKTFTDSHVWRLCVLTLWCMLCFYMDTFRMLWYSIRDSWTGADSFLLFIAWFLALVYGCSGHKCKND